MIVFFRQGKVSYTQSTPKRMCLILFRTRTIVREDEMGGVCGTCGEEEQIVQDFG